MTQVVDQAAPETQLVRGQVSSVVTKGADKWQVAVTPEGSQFAKNLWTKDQALVQQMMQNVGNWFDFLCGVSHWKMQDGTPVRSLWVNSVGQYGTIPEPPQQMPGAAPGVMQPQGQPPQALPQPRQSQPQTAYPPGSPASQLPPQQQPMQQVSQPQTAMQPPPAPVSIPEEVRQLRIMRQTAMKVAALLIPYLPEEQRNLSGMQDVGEWLVRYFTGGPQPSPQRIGQQPVAQQHVQTDGSPYDGQQPEEAGPVGDPYANDPGPQYAGDPGGFPA